jgi:hypothetical protein
MISSRKLLHDNYYSYRLMISALMAEFFAEPGTSPPLPGETNLWGPAYLSSQLPNREMSVANERRSPVLDKRKSYHVQHGVHSTKSLGPAKDSTLLNGSHNDIAHNSRNGRAVGNISSEGMSHRDDATSDVRSSLGLAGATDTVGVARNKLHMLSKFLCLLIILNSSRCIMSRRCRSCYTRRKF